MARSPIEEWPHSLAGPRNALEQADSTRSHYTHEPFALGLWLSHIWNRWQPVHDEISDHRSTEYHRLHHQNRRNHLNPERKMIEIPMMMMMLMITMMVMIGTRKRPMNRVE